MSENKPVPFFPATSTVFPSNQSQKRDTETKENRKETVVGEKPATSAESDDEYFSRITQPDQRKTIEMFQEWKHTENLEVAALKSNVPMSKLTDELLAKFVLAKTGNGERKTQGQWESQLLFWMKTEHPAKVIPIRPATAVKSPFSL